MKIDDQKFIQKKEKSKDKKILCFFCLNKSINNLSKSYKNCCSKFSLFYQFIIFLIPFSLILYIIIYIGNYLGFERIFKFDFFNTLKNEYIKYLISDIEDAHFQIGLYEMKMQFYDIENINFFQVYFREMISMGLLSEENIKIFPNISNNSEILYKSFDEFQNKNQMNSIYTLLKNESLKYIDNREDNLSELGKLYYYFLPIMTYEAFFKNTYINQTFFIAYEFDNKTKNIIGDEFYFEFPRLKSEMLESSNFYPSNGLISPKISKNETKNDEEFFLNNDYYKENWFTYQDYSFREQVNEVNFTKLSFSNLNYNYYGKLNQSNIVTVQDFIEVDGKFYIFNLIYYIKRKIFKDDFLELSIFMLFNNNDNAHQKEKYSNNDTFLISKSNIMDLTLDSKLFEYFHYGLKNKNNNFYKYGISFDMFDLDNMGEPLKYYQVNEILNIDLRYFSSLYLYSSLYKSVKFNQSKSEFKDLTQINFAKNEFAYQNICNEFDFTSYIDDLKEEDIDCWDDQNLLYYTETIVEEDMSLVEYVSKPYCICLPLYCIKNNNRDIKPNKIEFADYISLPSKCQVYYRRYLNNIYELYKSQNPTFRPNVTINFGLNNIYSFEKNIKNIFEDEYYIFIFSSSKKLFGITFFMPLIANNSNLENIYSIFVTNIDTMKAYFLLIILIGYFCVFLVVDIIFIINIKKVINIIVGYQKLYFNFISEKVEENTQKTGKNNNKNKILNESLENFGLPGRKKTFGDSIHDIYNKKSLFLNENPLISELFKMFCKYYKINSFELNRIINNNLNDENKLNENSQIFDCENELFYFLRIISLYIPKFKLKVSMDYNFYINSKLNKNYLKSITKNKIDNKQQIMLTQSIIYELLSTENSFESGLITNLNFNYITNIDLNTRKDNCIRYSLFNFAEKELHNKDKFILIDEDNNNKKDIKIIWKEKNKMLEEFENSFENDDYLKKDRLIYHFDSFIVNVYYKYLKKIISISEFQAHQDEDDIEYLKKNK